MSKENEEKIFSLFDIKFKVHLGGEGSSSSVDPSSVIAYVENMAKNLKKNRPHLDTTHCVVLTALNIALEKFKLEEEFKKDLSQMYQKAQDVFDLVQKEDVSITAPTQ